VTELLLGDIGPWAYALAASAVLVGAVLQSVTGMGFGVTAAPILVLVDPRFVPASVLLLGMLVASLAAVRGRADIAGGELGVALAGRVAGALVAGAALAAFGGTTEFSLMFAGLVLVAVWLSISKWHVRLTPKSLFVAGLSSGVMGTVTSIGAPPMGIVYQHTPAPKVRATLNGFFALGTVASLASLAAFGLFTGEHVILALRLLPALLAGFWLSRWCTGIVDRGRLRPLILGVCVASSLAIVWKVLS
jgi:uncharacterized membrane protein YfcA